MKHLRKNREQLLLVSGLMMFVCAISVMVAQLNVDVRQAGLYLLIFEIAPWVFIICAAAYALVQRGMRQPTSELSLMRLYSIQGLSHMMLVFAGLLMVENYNSLLMPYVVYDVTSYQTYMQIVRNNWVVFMLIGALIQLYTAMRIGQEMKKIEKK